MDKHIRVQSYNGILLLNESKTDCWYIQYGGILTMFYYAKEDREEHMLPDPLCMLFQNRKKKYL